VIHGTDTMSFTASALSFMIMNLRKTIIFTGSQISISEVRNDGNGNLLGALIIATHYCIPEVTLYFNNQLFRANRTEKYDCSGFGAYISPNFSPLAQLGVNVDMNWNQVLDSNTTEKFDVKFITERNVTLLKIFPGIPDYILKRNLDPPVVGVVLETFGAGNGPDNRVGFLKAIEEACQRGVVIVNISQCKKGGCANIYSTGARLYQAGVICGFDMTPEAALAKLMYVLSLGVDVKEAKQLMMTDLRGEMTDDNYKPMFSLKEKNFANFNKAPNRQDIQDLENLITTAINKHPNRRDIKDIENVIANAIKSKL